ncbi:efflux RND transporter permease subunit [Bryobacter aggregatus]|uniref:efflux RND transporter permease subunit n=1 Tax=Bryobacter aggregatus TaxID=360054 RepID=UPI0004E23A75|nr:efflux RND transporter permease subunit [Bryobacter aggregatus]
MASFSIRNPYFIVVCALILLLAGSVTLLRMPVDMFPALNQTVVAVATFYPGMPPEQVEKNITERQERFFTLAPGIEHIESRSLTGAGIIKIFFRPGTNPDAAISTVTNLAAAEQRRMPPGTLPPIVVRFDASSLPVCLIALRGDGLSEAQLRDVGHYRVRTQVAKVQGAAVPPPFGGRYRQIMVYVDPQKLEAHAMSAMDVVRAINESNLIMPAGTVKIGPVDYPIYTNSQFTNLDGILDLPIRTNGLAAVRVGDVAKVHDAAQVQFNTVRVDGQPSVYQPVLRQGGDANTIRIVDAVRAEAKRLLDVPENLEARVVFDQSKFIKNAIETLLEEGGIGLVLVTITILVFLGSARATVAVFFSIPLSALAAILFLKVTNGSLNSMTLGGLALAFSRLIDDSVVVLENIFRHMEMGKTPREAAEQGTKEVALPVLASTLTTAIVFLPVVLLTGVSQDLFVALGSMVVMSLAASYIVSMTLVPLFCAFVPGLHGHSPKWFTLFNMLFVKLMVGYERTVNRGMRSPGLVVVLGLATLAVTLPLWPLLGKSFFPRTDAGQFVINLKAASGTSLEETERKVIRVEQIVKRIVLPEDLDMMVGNIGVVPDFSAIYTPNSSPHTGFLQVSLKEKHKLSSQEYMRRVRAALHSEMPEVVAYFQSGGFVDAVLNFGMPAPIDLQISGPDLPSIHAAAIDLARQLKTVPGVSDVFIPQDIDSPALRIDVDRTQASLLGLTQREIASNLITSVASNTMIAPTFWTDPKSSNDYFLAVQMPENSVKNVSQLQKLPLRTKGDGIVNLDAVAHLTRVEGPTEVAHYGLRKVVDIYVNLHGEDLSRPEKTIQNIVAKADLSKGVTATLRGAVEGMHTSFASFGLGLCFALILLYLVLVAQFKSFLDPALILLAIPPGAAGVLLTLYLTGTTVNVQSLMGVIMMSGIVVSNSILLVDAAHREREQGLSAAEAASMAGQIRLRPILMTSLATIIGMLPMAMALGTGSEAYAPLARSIVGGLTVSLITTIFLVPAAYTLVYRRRERLAA